MSSPDISTPIRIPGSRPRETRIPNAHSLHLVGCNRVAEEGCSSLRLLSAILQLDQFHIPSGLWSKLADTIKGPNDQQLPSECQANLHNGCKDDEEFRSLTSSPYPESLPVTVLANSFFPISCETFTPETEKREQKRRKQTLCPRNGMAGVPIHSSTTPRMHHDRLKILGPCRLRALLLLLAGPG